LTKLFFSHSFYSTNKKVGYSSYIPRIKLPVTSLQQSTHPTLAKFWDWTDKAQRRIPKLRQSVPDTTSWPNSVYDFDEYDTKVFQLPSMQSFQRRSLQRKKVGHSISQEVNVNKVFKRQSSEPEIHQGNADLVSLHNSFNGSIGDRTSLGSPEPLTSSPAITIPVRKIAALNHLYSSSFGALNIEGEPRRSRATFLYYTMFYLNQNKVEYLLLFLNSFRVANKLPKSDK
jgi:hypothetical protein